MIRIYGIVYGDNTTEYTPFKNTATEKLWRFENNVMIEIIDSHIGDMLDDDLLGIFSWKFKSKTGINKNNLYRSFQDFKGMDIYNCCRYHAKNIHFMNWSDDGHKGIKGFIMRCCEHVGMEYTNDPKYIVYANQFVAKKHVYVSYVNDVIKPCLELLEGPMWGEVNRNAGYTRAMPDEKLKLYTGLDFYNYVPFILERMMCQYIFNKKLKCVDINRR